MDNTVFQSLAIIEEKIREKLTVETISEAVHFSKYHFQRMFREAAGDSVMRYVTRRRLTLAAADLIKTEDSVLEIALRYGYDSHEGFIRSFKAYIGITPREYRKYYSYIGTPVTKAEKEKSAMLYSKSTDEMICELNGLIVEARETAAFIRKNKDNDSPVSACYLDFWEYIANKTDKMAETLTEALKPIAETANQLDKVTAVIKTDEITARFIIIKIIDRAVFQLSTIEFQTGLTISRAKPEHRKELNYLGSKLTVLLHKANVTYAKMTVFLVELSKMIFEDMKNSARKNIDKAVQKGREAAAELSDVSAHYGYIKEGVEEIVNELSFLPIENVSTDFFNNLTDRLDIINFSAEMEILRNPSDKQLFKGIGEFKEQLSKTARFFDALSEEIVNSFDGRKSTLISKAERKRYGDMAFKEKVLLFYLKGEAQKLDKLMTDEQKAAFNNIFEEMNIAVRLANYSEYSGSDSLLNVENEIAECMEKIYSRLMGIKSELGVCGSAVGFLAEEIRKHGVFLSTWKGV